MGKPEWRYTGGGPPPGAGEVAKRLHDLRGHLQLSLSTIEALTGVEASRLKECDEGAGHFTEEELPRLLRVIGILSTLGQIMKASYIPVWLETPNKICKEFNAKVPLDLFKMHDFEAVEDIIYYMGSGTPG